MNIKDLRDGMRTVEVEGEVVEISTPREVSLRTGGQAKVADATLKDETGTIKLSLWDNQIDQVQRAPSQGLATAIPTTSEERVQLNVGRYGKLEVL